MKKLILFSITAFFITVNYAQASKMVLANDEWLSTSKLFTAQPFSPIDCDVIIDYVKAGNNGKALRAAGWSVLKNRINLRFGALYTKDDKGPLLVKNCEWEILDETEVPVAIDIEISDPGTPDLFSDVVAVGEAVLEDGDDAAAAPVPEPATMFLLGSGILGLAGAHRAKNKK